MSAHVMFPTCDKAYRVSYGLADFLNDVAEDFSIRYASIEKTPRVLRRLRKTAAAGGEDAEVAERMLQELIRDGAVEVFIST
jgi:hypothetical protein